MNNIIDRIKNTAFILLLGMLVAFPVKSQVTVGSQIAPQKGALLDLKENDESTGGVTSKKGLIYPRVSLTDVNNLYPMLTGSESNYATLKLSHTGMIVYNTNANPPFSKGIYVWDGTKWIAGNAFAKNDIVAGTSSSSGATVPLTITSGTGQVVGASNATLTVNNTAPLFNANAVQGIPISRTAPTDGQSLGYDAASSSAVWQTKGSQTDIGTLPSSAVTFYANSTLWYYTQYIVTVPAGKSTVYAGFAVLNSTSGYVTFSLSTSQTNQGSGLLTPTSTGGLTANPAYAGFTTIATVDCAGAATWYVNNTTGSPKILYIWTTSAQDGTLSINGSNYSGVMKPFVLVAY